ncbi:tyrosine-type recombinase/integrase [Silvibacterium sp.]|uniref:tyrosine-type recombinase/integrase n=1 Tax=Silvibacterium sp. TaxID=1964179 RepID=UPI0039E6C8AB
MHSTNETIPAHEWLQPGRKLAIEPGMKFEEAADLWIESRTLGNRNHHGAGFIRKNTEESYRQYLESLKLFFTGVRLVDIRLDHIRGYQLARVAGSAPFIRYRRPQDALSRKVGDQVTPPKGKTPCPAKPKKVNQEIMALILILKRAKLWGEDQQAYYEPLLEEQSDVQRALTPEEQSRWLGVARSTARWEQVYWYSLLAFQTCMSTNEIRSLRIGDINLQAAMLRIPLAGAKNQYRARPVHLSTTEAQYAMSWLLQRAQKLGATKLDHYLFPSRIGPGNWNPEAPMSESGIKKQWEEVRKASGLNWFRQYDCRHTAITRCVESGMSLGLVMKMAGHISSKMTAHYTHISEVVQARAMQNVFSGLNAPLPGGWNPPASFLPPCAAPAATFAPTPTYSAPVASVIDRSTTIAEVLRLLQQLGVAPEELSASLGYPMGPESSPREGADSVFF